MHYLKAIRKTDIKYPLKQQILYSSIFLIFGVILGIFSKYLDYQQSNLPKFLQMIDDSLDLHNFLGGFAPWVLLSVCIAIYSSSPFKAALNVFLFLSGMVTSYYIYSNYIAGFFPFNYALIWFGLAIISPIFGFICWYAHGTGIISLLLSGGIIGFLICCAFSFGMFYIDFTSLLNTSMLLIAIIILQHSLKDKGIIFAIGILVAVFIRMFLPFQIW